jgi:hypothetical protein
LPSIYSKKIIGVRVTLINVDLTPINDPN